MCHHYEGRDLEALRERLEAVEPEAEPPETAPMDPEPDDESRLPPIQPSD